MTDYLAIARDATYGLWGTASHTHVWMPATHVDCFHYLIALARAAAFFCEAPRLELTRVSSGSARRLA